MTEHHNKTQKIRLCKGNALFWGKIPSLIYRFYLECLRPC